ncbi:MAG TPA: 2-oxoacid:ferredoxin oxidoreductase subunit beta [Candidatus Azoamicus sp.]
MNSDKNYFESRREVKWCPGCGNYAILMSMQKTLFSLGLKNENIVFISGIGCSGRFPYYINTYGFHTLHGRAPAVATGLKLMRPDLTIWIVVGDGDAFSIGLSHIIHLIRRNINVNILFINNKIYALTKGQYSPTSDEKTITKSSPYGSLEDPINPLSIVLNSGCSFVARAVDNDHKNLKIIIEQAMKNNGTSFIEVLQNCNVFNNQIYNEVSDKNTRDEKNLYLKHGEYLEFGEKTKYILTLDENLNLNKIKLHEQDKNKIAYIHNTQNENIMQLMLAKIQYHETPYPLGIFRDTRKETYEDRFKNINASKKIKTINELFC